MSESKNPWTPLPPSNEPPVATLSANYNEREAQEAKLVANMQDVLRNEIESGQRKPAFKCQVFKSSWWQGGGYSCKVWNAEQGWRTMAWFIRHDWANDFMHEFAVDMCEQLVQHSLRTHNVVRNTPPD